MREIKFRAWDKALKTMSYSPLHSIGFDGKLYYGNADFKDYPVELMQFTGLHDKNGKEIWEGDVISYGTYKQVIEIDNHEDSDGALIRGYGFASPDTKGVEVIGNKFENPELLK